MKKKMAIILLCIVIVVCTVCVFANASLDLSRPWEVMQALVGYGEMPDYADANDDGSVTILDVITLVKQSRIGDVYAESITLDDEHYTFEFDKYTRNYTVNLPDGRPPIPQVSAKAADGLDVEIAQGYIADGESVGYAYVVVSNETKDTTYTIEFVRGGANGFVLQYDDRYTFTPVEKGEYQFVSSNESVLSVDENGLMTAKKVTNEPVTVTATSGNTVETLTIDRIEKAHINLFFITGQSNGQGCYDGVSYDGSEEINFNGQISYTTQLKTVEKIGQDGRIYSYDVHPRPENQDLSKIGDESLTIPAAYTLYDMNKHAKQGHQASLGKAWYEYTGEKVVFLQSAWSGAPIETWIDPDRYPEEAGGYGIATRNFYKTTKEGYNKLIPLLSENYEIIRKANFWCQGSTAMVAYYDKSISNYIFRSDAKYDVTKLITGEKYYEYYMRIDKDMREDFGLEYNGIMCVRAQGTDVKTTLTPIAAAHIALAFNNEKIFTASRRIVEIARKANSTDTTSEGYAFVGMDDAHFNQIGFNYQGREAAENAFGFIFKSKYEDAKSVEILATNGVDRLTPNDTIEMKEGNIYRCSALSVPMYSNELITWTSSDENVAKVDKYGVVVAVGSGEATIKATTESGAEQYFNVKVAALKLTKVNYRWDFNDLRATGISNDLVLSEATAANKGNYTLSNGVYSTGNKSLDYAKRPDFTFEKPFFIDSENDWSVEWRYKAYPDTAVTLIGKSPKPDETGYVGGRIYIYYAKEWGTGMYPINISFEEGNTVMINYGDYRLLNNEMNTWKLSYSKDTRTMSLLFYNETTKQWETVGTARTGEFSTTFTTLFGRQKQQGDMNFLGDVDYVEVNAVAYESTEYRWDFNDLKSSGEKNDLTLSPLASGTANNYTLSNGIYSTKTGISGYGARPDFTLENPFTVDSQRDWYIEWRAMAQTGTAVVLMGQTPTVAGDATDLPGYLYLSYSVNWGNNVYPLAFIPQSGNQVKLNYGSYRLLNNEMHTWRLSYSKAEKKMTLLLLDDATKEWITVDSKSPGEFSTTFTNLMGRVDGQASMNFVGSIDYIEVYNGR